MTNGSVLLGFRPPRLSFFFRGNVLDFQHLFEVFPRQVPSSPPYFIMGDGVSRSPVARHPECRVCWDFEVEHTTKFLNHLKAGKAALATAGTFDPDAWILNCKRLLFCNY